MSRQSKKPLVQQKLTSTMASKGPVAQDNQINETRDGNQGRQQEIIVPILLNGDQSRTQSKPNQLRQQPRDIPSLNGSNKTPQQQRRPEYIPEAQRLQQAQRQKYIVKDVNKSNKKSQVRERLERIPEAQRLQQVQRRKYIVKKPKIESNSKKNVSFLDDKEVAFRNILNNTTRKRKISYPLPSNTEENDVNPFPTEQENDSIVKCSFCLRAPAVVAVSLSPPPVSNRNDRAKNSDSNDTKEFVETGRTPKPRYLCLLHYYTTCSVQSRNVTMLNQEQSTVQIESAQRLFSEAFVQIQNELAESVARSSMLSFQKQHDPLSVVAAWSNKRGGKKNLNAPPKPQGRVSDGTVSEGGFLRNIHLPERFLETQQKQLQKHRELEKRIKEAANTSTVKNNSSDITKRRQPNKKSIWNIVDDSDRNNKVNKETRVPIIEDEDVQLVEDKQCTSCVTQEHTIQLLPSASSRSQDFTASYKGETWGSKDRDNEIINKYRCLNCGKVWTEQD